MVPANLNGRGETFLDPSFIKQSEMDPTNDDTPTETSAQTVSQSSEDDDDLLETEKKDEVINTPVETIEEPILEITPQIELEPQPVEPVKIESDPHEIERRRRLRIDFEKVVASILLLLFLINFFNI